MKIIKNKILIDINNEKRQSILINTLTGTMNVLEIEETECIKKWDNKKEIFVENVFQKKLYEELIKNKYIVESSQEEKKIVDNIMEKCRKNHELIKKENPTVVFVITYKCNFACPYCYENAPLYKEEKILNKEMVDKVFEIHKNIIKKIAFYGGEPFLPETKSIIEYIISKAPDAVYSATTNGYYLEDFIDILKSIKVSNIMVTLDGTEILHNKTRILKNGEGTYKKIINSIDKCLNNDISIKIRMNISENNINECMKLREQFIKKYKTKYDNGILMFELQPIFQIPSKKREVLNNKVFFEKNTENGYPYKYNMMSLTVSPVLREFVNNNNYLFRPRYCNCDAEGKRFFYDAEGDIYSCILSLKSKNAIVGKYFPDYYLKNESILTRNIENIKECRECKIKFLCGGGCTNEIIDEEGNVMKPNCGFIRNEVYNELPKLFRKYVQE